MSARYVPTFYTVKDIDPCNATELGMEDSSSVWQYTWKEEGYPGAGNGCSKQND